VKFWCNLLPVISYLCSGFSGSAHEPGNQWLKDGLPTVGELMVIGPFIASIATYAISCEDRSYLSCRIDAVSRSQLP